MKGDALRVIEAAYALGADERAWLLGLLETARPLLDRGLGVLGFSFRLMPASPIEVGPLVELGSSSDSREPLRRMLFEGPQDLVRAAFCSSRVVTLSEMLGALAERPFIENNLAAVGGRDAIGVLTVEPGGQGVVINVLLPEPQRLSPHFRRTWSCIAAHVGAAFRLLRRLPTGAAPIEAVMDAAGKVQHAEGYARSRDALSALRQAARAIDRARSSRTSNPVEALELWQALVEERWSLIDQFDADGRHFLIARANPVNAPPLRALSEAEPRVLALAALGRSNKLIAYELGVSTGAVGTLLSRAARKLAVASRSALIQHWHEQHSPGAGPQRTA